MEKTVSFITHNILVLLCFCSTASYAQNKDIEWLRQIHSNQSRNADGAMHLISETTYPLSAALPATELLYGYIKHDKKIIRNGWGTCAAMGVNFVLAYGLKYSLNRNRPYEAYTDIIPRSYDTDPSFPSGHTSFAFNTATSLSVHYPKWYVIAPAYLWAGAVGYSRMYMGYHYPTDVLAGALVGAGSAYLAYKGQQWLWKRKTKKAKVPVE